MASDPEMTVFDDVAALQENVVDAIAALIAQTTEKNGVCRISLSGGGTPKRIYELLSDRDLPWDKVHWFWGDERNVSPDDEQSNYRMVKLALLDPAKIPPANVHRVPIDASQNDDPETIANRYERQLRDQFGGQTHPKWDLILLGMGDDAHTASLFPYTKALEVTDRWFVENWVEKFDTYRYTLTADAINSGDQIWFLVAGANKRESLRAVHGDCHDPQSYPSQLIHPTRWFVTADAAIERS